MRVRRSEDTIAIELTPAEARVFLNELLDVPGGARRPKIRQVCAELSGSFALTEMMAPKRLGRPVKEEEIK